MPGGTDHHPGPFRAQGLGPGKPGLIANEIRQIGELPVQVMIDEPSVYRSR
jgi:hypothetical protein